jgi:tetratricopeptide (TPR) repeat protein
VAALAVSLTDNEQESVLRKETNNIDAYDAFLKGTEQLRRFTPDRIVKALTYYEEAVGLDPNYGRAYAGLAEAYSSITWYPAVFIKLGLSSRERALRMCHYLDLAMQHPTSIAHRCLSFNVYSQQRRYEDAIAEAQRAFALDPNDARSNRFMAWSLLRGGADQGMPLVISTGP